MNSNTQDSNAELASFYQNTQNGPIETMIAPIEELNNSKTLERLLETYFVMIVQKNFDKAFELFERIINLSKSDTFIYLCFWYPFSLSEEEMVERIIKRAEIRFKETVITKANQLSIGAKEFNTYAFDLALSMKLPDNLLSSIISQGKISVKLEWIAEQLNRGKYELVESMWKSQAECKIDSDELKAGFNTLIVKDDEDPQNDARKFMKSFSLMENRKKNNANVGKLLWKNIGKIKDKELKTFLEKQIGKLTLSKIIILVKIQSQIQIFKNKHVEEIELKERKRLRKLIRNICLFDTNKKHSVEIIEALYFIDEKKVCRELLESNLINIDINIFRESIINKDFKFALFFYKCFNDFKFFDNENLHIEILENLQKNVYFLEFYLYFIKKFLKFFNLKSAKIFLKVVEEILSINNKSTIFIISNPIKQFVLMAEVLRELKAYYYTLEYSLDKLIEKILEDCERMQGLVEEDTLFYEMCLEKDLDNRSLINIISDNDFLNLLKNSLIEKSVNDLWNGPYSTQGSFFEVSSNINHFFINIGSKDYDAFTKQRNDLLEYNPYSYKTNFTHFKVWKKSITIKFIFELVFNFILMNIYLFSCLQVLGENLVIIKNDVTNYYLMNNTINSFLNVVGNSNLTDFNITQVINDTTIIQNITDSKNFYFNVRETISSINYRFSILKYFNFFFLTTPASYIIRLIFMIKSQKPSFGLEILPDSIIFVFIMINLIFLNYDTAYLDFLSENVSNSPNDFSFANVFYKLENIVGIDGYENQFMAVSFLCLLLWVKTLVIFKGTKVFGPIIVIFLLSVKGIWIYILSFLCVNVVGSTFGYMFFYRVNEYFTSNWLYSFMYYFFMSLGGGDPSYTSYLEPSLIEQKPYIPYVFSGFIILYLVANAVIFLNLVIALLANIYEKFYSQSIQLFIQQKLEIRRKYYTDDERYDSLLNSNFPLDAISLPYCIGFLFTNNLKVIYFLNQVINIINFLPFAFLYTLFFATVTFLLIPFSYLWVIICKFFQIFVEDIQQYYLIYKIFSFFLYILFGLYFHIKSYFTDIIIFVMQLARRSLPLLSDSEEKGKYQIPMKLLTILFSLIGDFNNEREVYKVSINQFIETLSSFLAKKDIYEAKEKLRIFISKFDITNQEMIQMNITRSISKNIENNGFNYMELLELLGNFVDERNYIDLLLMNRILIRRMKIEKMLIFQKEILDKSFNLKQELLQNNFYKKVGIVKGVRINIEDQMLNENGTIQEQEYNTVSKYDMKENPTINYNVSTTEKKQIKKKFYRLKILGKIKDPIVTFVIIPRVYIYEFISSLKDFQNDINKNISENLMRNETYLKKLDKDKSKIDGALINEINIMKNKLLSIEESLNKNNYSLKRIPLESDFIKKDYKEFNEEIQKEENIVNSKGDDYNIDQLYEDNNDNNEINQNNYNEPLFAEVNENNLYNEEDNENDESTVIIQKSLSSVNTEDLYI